VNVDPKYAEYSLQTSRPKDMYWSVNQTRVYAQAGEREGTLDVQFETVTPNFDHFLVQIDDGEWTEHSGPLEWTLHPGDNELAVRGVNAFGMMGHIARARVHRAG